MTDYYFEGPWGTGDPAEPERVGGWNEDGVLKIENGTAGLIYPDCDRGIQRRDAKTQRRKRGYFLGWGCRPQFFRRIARIAINREVASDEVA